MRAVRLVGLADSGRELVCEDPTTGERFLLARDDRLRAAARGELGRFGEQLELDGQSQIPPKEIQARIRAGATVEQVAALAGTSIRRVERFAHPVLLERSTIAEKARLARPTIDGIHGSASVQEAVGANLAARGHDGDVNWDAYRDEADWVLVLTWHVGRSLNRAQWTFHPGPAGGTLTARDENAADIVDPALRVLRPLREVAAEVTPATKAERTTPSAKAERTPPSVEELVTDERAGAKATVVEPAALTGTDGGELSAPASGAPEASRPAQRPAPRPNRKNTRPVMPSWEDVLLGTRAAGK